MRRLLAAFSTIGSFLVLLVCVIVMFSVAPILELLP